MTSRTPEELERAREWLRSEASTKSVEEQFEGAKQEAQRLADTARAIPSESLALVPEGEEWSPLLVLQHAVQANAQVAEDILHVSLTGERPGNPEPAWPADLDTLLAKQAEALDSLWAHISAADAKSFLEIRWPHMFFGELNWREWLSFLELHAWDHRNQIIGLQEKLLA